MKPAAPRQHTSSVGGCMSTVSGRASLSNLKLTTSPRRDTTVAVLDAATGVLLALPSTAGAATSPGPAPSAYTFRGRLTVRSGRRIRSSSWRADSRSQGGIINRISSRHRLDDPARSDKASTDGGNLNMPVAESAAVTTSVTPVADVVTPRHSPIGGRPGAVAHRGFWR